MSPNVILITIDSLRADHLSCLGYSKTTTPNIDALAKNGALFTNAFANGGGSATSFPSIITSTYASMNISSAVYNAFWIKLSKRYLTVAEILKNEGFATAAFKNYKDDLCSIFGYDKGFNVFNEKIHFNDNKINQLYQKSRFLLGNKYIRADQINKKAISWCSKTKKDFFLWLHYMDVHLPYNPKNVSISKRLDAIKLGKKKENDPNSLSELENSTLIDFYDAEISYCDDKIGELLHKLEKIKITPDNTYFILLSDHGDQFMEHGEWGHGRLYDEVLHVPLIICGPELKQNRKIMAQVSLLAVAPTLTHLLNIKKSDTFCGSNLSSLIEGDVRKSNDVISEEIGQDYSYRTQKWKFIRHCRTNTYELFDLTKDPQERFNVFYNYPEIADDFDQLLNQHIERGNRIRPSVLKENVFSVKEKNMLKNVMPKEEDFISKVLGVPRKR